MNCKKCGAVISPNESVCRNCGAQIDNINPQPIVNENVDDLLISSYIGKNADKLMKGNFSFCTFLLGPMYVLYRKMWLLGFIWFIINFLILNFLPLKLTIIVIAIDLVVAFLFKKIYIGNVKKKVQNIKSENSGKIKEQLLEICKQKGGTSLVVSIIIGIIFAIYIISIVIGTIFVGNSMNNLVKQACCNSSGGVWSDGSCTQLTNTGKESYNRCINQ